MNRKSTARDMTQGAIVGNLIMFALPLLLGNLFQMMYNTVDTLVVGNFVSTQALAAIGSTTMIVNMAVFFFNGLSVGAGVIIGQNFGARDLKKLHIAVETTVALTFLMGLLFTIGGILLVGPMLRLMATPADVFPEAMTYLRIYFAGISGLMVYNMGSGILRAVGDTTRPLYFLIFTSIVNICLDLLFVLGFKAGIGGVALATIISQFLSATLVLFLLTRTEDIYQLVWKDLRLDLPILKQILALGLPAAIQSIITSFSNVFVQSYINVFGAAVMAGWSCYNKIDALVYLPVQSMCNATTTFVSQNFGAGEKERVKKGTLSAIFMTLGITTVLGAFLIVFAEAASVVFTRDAEVVHYSVHFIRLITGFLLFNCVNQVFAGALRGRGDAKGPMFIMLSSFVVLRQIYLFFVTRYFSNTTITVGLGYPVGWVTCFVLYVLYYLIRYRNAKE